MGKPRVSFHKLASLSGSGLPGSWEIKLPPPSCAPHWLWESVWLLKRSFECMTYTGERSWQMFASPGPDGFSASPRLYCHADGQFTSEMDERFHTSGRIWWDKWRLMGRLDVNEVFVDSWGGRGGPWGPQLFDGQSGRGERVAFTSDWKEQAWCPSLNSIKYKWLILMMNRLLI